MDQIQYSIHQLLQNKRDQLRDTLRKNDLKQIFQDKRTQFQQNQESTTNSPNSINQKLKENQQSILIESESDEEKLTRLTKIRSKDNLTTNYLNQIIQYLNEMRSSYQQSKILLLCENAILDKNQRDPSLVPALTEIIYLLTKQRIEIPFEPIPLLLNAYSLHQDYVILQYIKMYLQKYPKEITQVDQYCRKQATPDVQNLLSIICSNKKYSNFQMILFLCEKIRNIDMFNALSHYGGKKLCFENKNKKEYKKIIEKILEITNWKQESLQVNNQEYQYD